MKKTIILISLLCILTLSLTSCISLSRLFPVEEDEGLAEAFVYNYGVTLDEHSRLFKVFDNTVLKLYDDGTWCLVRTGWFSDKLVDEGTYEFKNNTYYVYEFEDYTVSGEIDEDDMLTLCFLNDSHPDEYVAKLHFDKAVTRER